MEENPKKIFIIDDEENITWSLSRLLRHSGYYVKTSNFGKEALNILRTENFDLVITDIRMPDVDGFEILKWLVSHAPQTKVFMITAYGSPSVMDAAQRKGALYYFEKPIDHKKLISAIKEALEVTGFVGTVEDITIFDYIQLCIFTGATKLIRVTKGDMVGTIGFNKGAIVFAECGDLYGEEAVYEILSWEGGKFSDIRAKKIPEANIDKDSNYLLMEAMRRIDEKKEKEAKKRELKRKLGEDRIEAIKEAQKELCYEFSSPVASFTLETETGAIVAGYSISPDADPSEVAETLLKPIQSLDSATTEMNWGDPRNIYIITETCSILALYIPVSYTHLTLPTNREV